MKIFPDSGFHKKKFSFYTGIPNIDSSHGAKYSDEDNATRKKTRETPHSLLLKGASTGNYVEVTVPQKYQCS